MRSNRQRGVTLVELVVSIVIIAVAVSAVLGVFTLNAKRSADALVSEQAVAIATAYLEEISLKPFADPDGVSGESARADFDDVQDYDGLNDATGARDQFGNALPGLEAYRVNVSVTPGNLHGLASSDVHRIDVAVQHVTGFTLRLSGYRTRY